MRALAVVFASYGLLHRFSEPGPTAGGPRTLVCRNAFIAVVATEVRAHLAKGASANDSDDEAEDAAAAHGVEHGSAIPFVDTYPVEHWDSILGIYLCTCRMFCTCVYLICWSRSGHSLLG